MASMCACWTHKSFLWCFGTKEFACCWKVGNTPWIPSSGTDPGKLSEKDKCEWNEGWDLCSLRGMEMRTPNEAVLVGTFVRDRIRLWRLSFLNGINVLIKRPVFSLAPSAMKGHRKMPVQDSELAISSACSLTLNVPNSRTVKRNICCLKDLAWGWRDSSTIKSTCCSFKRPGFGFQSPYGGSQPFTSLVSEDPKPSSMSMGTRLIRAHSYVKASTHTHQLKLCK